MFFWRMLGLWLTLVLLAACAGVSAAPPLTSKQLKLYGFSEYIPQDLLTGFEKSAGVEVVYETYSNNEEMLSGLTAKPGNYDLLIPSDYAVEILINQDKLQPLNLAQIPNYNNIDPAFLSPYFDPGGDTEGRRPALRNQKFSLPYQWGTTGILYNPAKVSEPITRWEDLWRPELAGHVVALDDPRELMGLTLLTLGYDKNETNPARLAEARDKLKKLAPGVIAFDSATPEDYLLSGDAWAGVVFNGNAALAARQNPDLSYVLPAEGAGIWFDNLVIPADASHPDAAVAFINYVLQPENSILITREFPYSNPNEAALNYLKTKDANLYAGYIGSPASNPSPDALAGAHLVKNVGPQTSALYEQYWAEVKSSR
ncbi:MAG: spermidine/putrescine ABC transporter substrate-binding protein [Anaerolineae bacterium]